MGLFGKIGIIFDKTKDTLILFTRPPHIGTDGKKLIFMRIQNNFNRAMRGGEVEGDKRWREEGREVRRWRRGAVLLCHICTICYLLVIFD